MIDHTNRPDSLDAGRVVDDREDPRLPKVGERVRDAQRTDIIHIDRHVLQANTANSHESWGVVSMASRKVRHSQYR